MASQQSEVQQQQTQMTPPPPFFPMKAEHPGAFQPMYHNMVYPNIYATGHLAPGTYFSTVDQGDYEEEESDLHRRLGNLGVTLVLSGMLSVLLGLCIVLLSTWYVHFVIVVGVPWWSGLLTSVAGMLALGARGHDTNSMTTGCLVMNVVNGLSNLPAAILYAMSIDFFSCFWFFCFGGHRERLISVLLIFLLMNSVVSLLVSIVVASMNCKRLRCCTSKPATTMIVVQAPPPAPVDPTYCTIGAGEQPPAYSPAQPAVYNVPV